MGSSVVEAIYQKYERLIAKAAWSYTYHLPRTDVDDLIQSGALRIVERFHGCDQMPSDGELNSFKRGLILYLRKLAVRIYRRRPPTDRYGNSVNLDSILVAADTDVLSQIYEREYRQEIRRLMIDDIDRHLYDMMVSGESDRYWVGRAAATYGVQLSLLYRRIGMIRQRVERYLRRS